MGGCALSFLVLLLQPLERPLYIQVNGVHAVAASGLVGHVPHSIRISDSSSRGAIDDTIFDASASLNYDGILGGENFAERQQSERQSQKSTTGNKREDAGSSTSFSSSSRYVVGSSKEKKESVLASKEKKKSVVGSKEKKKLKVLHEEEPIIRVESDGLSDAEVAGLLRMAKEMGYHGIFPHGGNDVEKSAVDGADVEQETRNDNVERSRKKEQEKRNDNVEEKTPVVQTPATIEKKMEKAQRKKKKRSKTELEQLNQMKEKLTFLPMNKTFQLGGRGENEIVLLIIRE